MKTITLYRPVGETEMRLIIESDYKQFPPRLYWQPIFYPVLNEAYATQIAKEWNTQDAFGNYLGFVTKFCIPESLFLQYEVQNVGGDIHNELWIPAEDLDAFNKEIIRKIEVVHVFVGEQYTGSESVLIKELIKKLTNEP